MIRDHSNNKGTYRKDIWQMLLDNKEYKKAIDYYDFLKAFQVLVRDGSLCNTKNALDLPSGIYVVEPNTFKELSK